MSAEKVHAVIIVDSAKRHISQSKSRTDFIYRMVFPVNFYNRGKDKQYFVRIENVNLPISFYAINSTNNVLNFTDSTDGLLTVTITPGNYTIDELLAELQTVMNAAATTATFTLTYDEITQKTTFAWTGGTTITFEDTSTLFPLLGLREDLESAKSTPFTATDVSYTNTTRYVKLFVDNINSNNVYDNDNVQKVAVKLPINEVRNEFQFYDNHRGYKIQLPSMPSINEMRIKLTDPDNNVIDLNGVDWSFDVVFYEWTRPGAELSKHIRSIGGSSLSRGAAASGH